MAGDGHNIDTNPAPKELQKPLFCLGNFFKWLPCSVSQLRRIKNISERKRDEQGKQAWECSLSLTLVVNGLGWGALECSKRSQEKTLLVSFNSLLWVGAGAVLGPGWQLDTALLLLFVPGDVQLQPLRTDRQTNLGRLHTPAPHNGKPSVCLPDPNATVAIRTQIMCTF